MLPLTPTAPLEPAEAPQSGETAAATDGTADVGSQKWMERIEKRLVEAEKAKERLGRMEERVQQLEEEVRRLRERVEEGEWANGRLELKMTEREEEAREEWKEAIAATGKGLSDELKEIKKGREAPEANLAPPKENNHGGGERRRSQGGGRGPGERRRERGIILTDSNGREATADSIRNHLPREEKDEYEIEVCVAYTLEEAFYRVARGDVDVREATVVIDNITNDVRGTQQKPAATPEDTVFRVDKLRRKLLEAGAKAVVVAEIKPMQWVDVRPHNRRLHYYLLSQGRDGHGISTQIRMNFLRNDGFHVRREFDYVIDGTYACAILGVPVPYPTPTTDFEPEFVRRQRHTEWPLINDAYAQSVRTYEGQNRIRGWKW